MPAPIQHAQIAPPVQTVLPNQNAGMGDLNLPHTQIQPNQVFQQPQQVQQPGPFQTTAQPAGAFQAPTGSNQFPNPSGTSTIPNTVAPVGTAPTASPSEPAGQRRRRRTQAEMQATNGVAPAPVQAPFPHPGSEGAPAATQASFGIAQGQPASGNPELSGMLDDFFKQG